MQPLQILVVEDEEAHVELIRRAFAETGQQAQLQVVPTLAATRAYLQNHQPDLAIIDLMLPDGPGTSLLPVTGQLSTLPAIIMTSYGNERSAVEAVKAGALDYVVKSPNSFRDLPRAAERSLREWEHLIERQRAEQALLQNERRFRALTEYSSDVISVLDSTGTILYRSLSVTRVMGYTPTEHIGKNGFDFVHPDDYDDVLAHFAQLCANPDQIVTAEFRLRHQNGSWRWVEATATNLLADLAIQGIVVNYRDITERKRAALQLEHAAHHDYLTGLPNRLFCTEWIAQRITRLSQDPSFQFTVLFLDLDHFKVINDSLGHRVGDQVLQAVAVRLQTCIDTHDFCARLGGDEFVIVLDNNTQERDVVKLAEKIAYQLAQPFEVQGMQLVTTASIGIVDSTVGYLQPEEVLRDADIAMYNAKMRGKSRYTIFNTEMREQARTRLALEAEIRRAIDQNEFEVHYQPIVELQTGQLEGFEALVRWRHPQRGLLSPAVFVPVAEETGQIVAIDWLVLREASRQMHSWQSSLGSAVPLVMSVNFSSQQFAHHGLVEQLMTVLAETDLTPRHLRLEITESTLMENIDMAAGILTELNRLGAQVAIDDFGTGYSSLEYLAQLPLNVLKIDRRFVSQMEQESRQRELVKAMVTMAHNLSMGVVAEGVETASQRTRLHKLGCKWMQGYFIARPMSGSETATWYASWDQAAYTHQYANS